MPFYCHQVNYTKEVFAHLIKDPQDRMEIVRVPIEKLGGKLHTAFFAFGPFDAIAITEMPDNVSAAAIAIAFAAGGSVSHVQTTALMTSAQFVEALRKAGTCGYKSVVASAKASSAGS
ncbi:MAG TPA: GYD domain-containing protein [Candidatus Acidoferrum sp.]